MSSFLEKLKKRREAMEEVGKTTSKESVKKSQEAAKAFESDVSSEKKKRKQNENSRDGYNY